LRVFAGKTAVMGLPFSPIGLALDVSDAIMPR
jgi:hypothetical protein